MTIGIAAFGPEAGRAVLRALAAVEAVGRGAIGGFVSFVAITGSGIVRRAETQRGGSGALFPGGLGAMPAELAEADVAGLMSSGPDRPAPLAQFTPADARIGLVTGHRMPNTVGASGMSLGDEVLTLMRAGLSPAEAVEQVVAANPDVDAGIVALSVDGGCGVADTLHVGSRRDLGRAVLGSRAEGAVVVVLHNAIRPHRPLAALAAEIAMDVMRPSDKPDGWITFRRGVRVDHGPADAVGIDAAGRVELVTVRNPKFLHGLWSLGIGFETAVFKNGEPMGTMLYEPYMVVDEGRLRSIDGLAELDVPVRLL